MSLNPYPAYKDSGIVWLGENYRVGITKIKWEK